MIKDPEGAYSQLIRLQQGAKKAEVADNSKTFDTIDRSGSHGSSIGRSVSQGSSGRRVSFSFSSGVPVPINIIEEEGDKRTEKTTMDIEKSKKVPITRLAYLNKPEIPILLFGSLAAAIHGVVFPIFGLLLSSSIDMFYKPPNELRKDSKFWAVFYVCLGSVTLIVIPIQNYLFGIAGGKLILRIRSLTFEKIVHQEISWFDDLANSRSVKTIVIFKML